MTEDSFLCDILSDPANAASTWLVFADWLEERGDTRAELTRLLHDRNFRRRFQEAAQQREAALEAAFKRAGVAALSLSTEEDLVRAIVRFASLRRRR